MMIPLFLMAAAAPAATLPPWAATPTWNVHATRADCGIGRTVAAPAGDVQVAIVREPSLPLFRLYLALPPGIALGPPSTPIDIAIDGQPEIAAELVGSATLADSRSLLYLTAPAADLSRLLRASAVTARGPGGSVAVPLRGSAAVAAAAAKCEADLLAAWGVEPYPPGATPARETGNPGTWISNADYPHASMVAHRGGDTTVLLRIDATGRLAGCDVIVSAGAADLDDAACAVLRERGRWRPATDAGGKPISWWTLRKFRWRLPPS